MSVRGVSMKRLLALVLALPSLALGQANEEVFLKNWSAPPFWQAGAASAEPGGSFAAKAGEGR